MRSLVEDIIAFILREECQWDERTRQFGRRWKAKGLRCAKELADLCHLAGFYDPDTADLEALHASIRRLSGTMGTQTHVVDPESASERKV